MKFIPTDKNMTTITVEDNNPYDYFNLGALFTVFQESDMYHVTIGDTTVEAITVNNSDLVTLLTGD